MKGMLDPEFEEKSWVKLLSRNPQKFLKSEQSVGSWLSSKTLYSSSKWIRDMRRGFDGKLALEHFKMTLKKSETPGGW